MLLRDKDGNWGPLRLCSRTGWRRAFVCVSCWQRLGARFSSLVLVGGWT